MVVALVLLMYSICIRIGRWGMWCVNSIRWHKSYVGTLFGILVTAIGAVGCASGDDSGSGHGGALDMAGLGAPDP